MSLTLPIVIGKKYMRRDGVIIIATERHASILNSVVYVGASSIASSSNLDHVWIRNGRVYSGTDLDGDLIADFVEPVEATPQAAPVAASHPDLGALTRYEHYCSYDGGGGADEEVEADGSWVRYDDVVKLLSATQPSPQAAPVAAVAVQPKETP
jgi:hypothetical protein